MKSRPPTLARLPRRKPDFIEPMDCAPVTKLADGPGWLYEIKLDGYRAVAVKSDGCVSLLSRGRKSFDHHYALIVEALAELPEGTVVDGEIVALDESGRPNFNLLQNFRSEASRIQYFIFDLLICNDRDLTRLPLDERRKLMKSLLKLRSPRLRIAEQFEASANDIGDLERAVSYIVVVDRGQQDFVRIRRMPLDEIGRRYADSFYQRRLHEISPTQPQRIGALQNQHASRGSIRSSGYIREHYKLLLEDIDSLAQAKLEGLIKAYEKSGMPFNEAAFYDVKQQIVDFCQSEQHKLIGSMNKTVGQFLGGVSFEPFAKEIVAGIDAIIGRLVCDLEMRRDEAILEDRRTKKAYAAGLGKQWDAFICHASEDKKDFVDEFARRLHDSGLAVWYDAFSLKLGDSLRRKIDEGLANSRYGIVVLSKHFFAKEWPQNELDGLMSREIAGTKVILPIWHKLTAEQVRQHSPILAGRVAARSEHGLEKVIAEVREAMGL